MPELVERRCPSRRSARVRTLHLIVLVALVCAACGGTTTRKGRTVTFTSGGNFPPSTIVGSYSVRGCAADTKTVVNDARLYYRHSTGAPGPADLYYYDMREAYAHFQADVCTSKQLGEALERGLTARQRTFLLHNVASDLHHALSAALHAAGAAAA
jgi:hypothetical protein